MLLVPNCTRAALASSTTTPPWNNGELARCRARVNTPPSSPIRRPTSWELTSPSSSRKMSMQFFDRAGKELREPMSLANRGSDRFSWAENAL